MLKLTTDRHEASRGLFATAELLVIHHLHWMPPLILVLYTVGYTEAYNQQQTCCHPLTRRATVLHMHCVPKKRATTFLMIS